MSARTFHFGDWQVDPEKVMLRNATAEVQIDPRAMDVLVALCAEAGNVVSTESLLRQCWGNAIVGENQVHKAITQLRRALGDNTGSPRYIETIRKRGYRTLSPVLRAADGVSVANRGSWTQASPYVGLDSFDESRSTVFFGRDAAISQLFDVLVQQNDRSNALVLVLGTSGSGKTSLIQAGLIPALKRAAAPIHAVAGVTLDLGEIGDLPLLTALSSCLLDADFEGNNPLEGYSAESLANNIMRTPMGVANELRRLSQTNAADRLILFIDKFEAYFSLERSAEERQQFMQAIDMLARSGGVAVIIACRNDFYPQVANEAVLMAVKREGAHFDLLPPSRAEIALMVRLPAEAAGLSFGKDEQTGARLDDLLCEGAANSRDALPLLQYTLNELYLRRNAAGVLSMASYRELGGIEGVIGRRAEAVFELLPEEVRASLPRILSMLIDTQQGSEAITGRYVAWSALKTDTERALVQAFVEERLFVSFMVEREPAFGPAHEALLRQWKRITDWADQHRHALAMRGRLTAQAAQWMADGKLAERLLQRGRPLGEAQDLIKAGSVSVSQEIQDYITASTQRARRLEFLRRTAFAGMAVLTAIALVLGFKFQQAERIANMRRQQAEDLVTYMVGDLADKLRPIGRLELLDGVGKLALKQFAGDRGNDNSMLERRNQAKALMTIAEVARSRADRDTAVKALNQARELLRSNLAVEGENVALIKDLGENAFWLGQMQLDNAKWADAEKYFNEYREHAEHMMKLTPGDVDAWVELSYALNSLGTVSLREGHEKLAANYFSESIKLKQRAVEQHPEDRKLSSELADSYSWLGSSLESSGNLKSALEYHEKARDIFGELSEAAPSELELKRHILNADLQISQLEVKLGEDEKAVSLMQSASKLSSTLRHQDSSNRVWVYTDLLVTQVLAEALGNVGRVDESVALQNVAIEGVNRLLDANPNNFSWQLLRMKLATGLSENAIRHRDFDLAMKSLERANTLFEGKDSLIRHTDGAMIRVQMLSLLSLIYAEEKRADDSVLACDKANQFSSSMKVDSRDPRALESIVRTSICSGKKALSKEALYALNSIGHKSKGLGLYVDLSRTVWKS